MKIAHLSSVTVSLDSPFGGTEEVIRALIKEQLAHGHEVFYFGASSGPMPTIPSRSYAKPVRALSSWPVEWGLRRAAGIWHTANSYLRSGQFDIVHNHLTEEGIAMSFLSSPPVLTTLHGPAHRSLPKYMIPKLFSLTGRTKLVAISYSSETLHRPFYGDSLLGYVHHGIDLSEYPFSPRSSGSHELNLGFCGRISPEKGVLEAIRVADILASRVDVTLDVVGRIDKSRLWYLERVASEVAKRDYVSLTVNLTLSKIKRFYGSVDVLLFPSTAPEPFGLVQVEAMACGTPVVAFPVGSCPEIVRPGICGYLPMNVDQMAADAIKAKDLKREACRREVEERFSSKVMYDRYLQVYDRVTGS